MKTKEKINKLSIILIIFTLSLILLTGCGKEKNVETENTNYTRALEYMCLGLETADSTTYLKAFPNISQSYYSTRYTDEYLQSRLSDFEDLYGKNIKISYEIIKENRLDTDDIEDITYALNDKFSDENTDSTTVSDGYQLSIKIIVSGDNDSESYSGNVYVCKIDDLWYLYNSTIF